MKSTPEEGPLLDGDFPGCSSGSWLKSWTETRAAYLCRSHANSRRGGEELPTHQGRNRASPRLPSSSRTVRTAAVT